jgi:hypothetical protein
LLNLRSTDPRDDKKRIEHTKGGLLRDSYDWILDNLDFRQWRNDREIRLLWIKGDPGKGKTMLLCGIIDELNKPMIKKAILSFFFCQATDSRINNATAVLRGLIYLLVEQQPSLIIHVRKKYDYSGNTLFHNANAWFSLSEIFADILQDPSLNSTYLIVDALDECIVDLPKLLAFIIQRSAAYSRVKWLVSSRSRPDIEKSMGDYVRKLSLELNAEHISTAVSKFIRHKVLQLEQQKGYDNKLRDAVLDYLSTNANDTFFWAASVCQNLQNTTTWNTLSALREFPPGLDSLYGQMMKQICELDESDLCKRILASVALVYRPITLTELTSLVDMLEDMSEDFESLREIIAVCSTFLTIREDTIYFAHHSAKEYLLTEASDEIFPSGQQEIHHEIFSRSLRVMFRTLRRDIYGLGAIGYPIHLVKSPDPDPLSASYYSCVYWVDHLCDSGANHGTDLEVEVPVENFLRTKYLYWLEALSLCRNISEGVMSVSKLEALIQVITNSSIL